MCVYWGGSCFLAGAAAHVRQWELSVDAVQLGVAVHVLLFSHVVGMFWGWQSVSRGADEVHVSLSVWVFSLCTLIGGKR